MERSLNPTLNRVHSSKSPIRNFEDVSPNKIRLINSKSSNRILENTLLNKTFSGYNQEKKNRNIGMNNHEYSIQENNIYIHKTIDHVNNDIGAYSKKPFRENEIKSKNRNLNQNYSDLKNLNNANDNRLKTKIDDDLTNYKKKVNVRKTNEELIGQNPKASSSKIKSIEENKNNNNHIRKQLDSERQNKNIKRKQRNISCDENIGTKNNNFLNKITNNNKEGTLNDKFMRNNGNLDMNNSNKIKFSNIPIENNHEIIYSKRTVDNCIENGPNASNKNENFCKNNLLNSIEDKISKDNIKNLSPDICLRNITYCLPSTLNLDNDKNTISYNKIREDLNYKLYNDLINIKNNLNNNNFSRDLKYSQKSNKLNTIENTSIEFQEKFRNKQADISQGNYIFINNQNKCIEFKPNLALNLNNDKIIMDLIDNVKENIYPNLNKSKTNFSKSPSNENRAKNEAMILNNLTQKDDVIKQKTNEIRDKTKYLEAQEVINHINKYNNQNDVQEMENVVLNMKNNSYTLGPKDRELIDIPDNSDEENNKSTNNYINKISEKNSSKKKEVLSITKTNDLKQFKRVFIIELKFSFLLLIF